MIAIVRVKGKKGKKEYGEKIPISRGRILDGIDNVICRATGAASLYGENKVEVEFSCDGDKVVLEGYSEIKDKIGSYEFYKFLKKIFNL